MYFKGQGMNNYCFKMGIGCEFANLNGYCSVTGCRKSLTWNIGNEHYLFEPEPEHTCKMYRDEHGTWHCESCENGGDNITGSDGVLDMWYDSWHPNYCPWCGARVEQ